MTSPAAFVEGLDEDAGIDDFSDILGDEPRDETLVLPEEEDEGSDGQMPNITI